MRKVIMYNVYFGDCFQIKDGKGSLVVDYGTHMNSKLPVKAKRQKLFDIISNELNGLRRAREVLITHFHEDHISGLMNLIKCRRYTLPFFQRAYIPDIFTPPADSPVSKLLVLHLLDELLSCVYFPLHKITLLDFCKFLYGGTECLQLLKRGDTFRDYIALWPDINTLCNENGCNNVLSALRENNPEFYNEINEIAEGITRIIELKVLFKGMQQGGADLEEQVSALQTQYGANYQADYGQDINQSTMDIYAVLNHLKHRMKILQRNVYEILNSEDKAWIKAKEIGNWASIVFHNSQDDDSNLLFTGDITVEYMNNLAEDHAAPSLPLHSTYRFIKVPHHGTNSHYFNFSPYNPMFLMIPIGKCRNYQISARYALASSFGTKLYCSNCNCCPCSKWVPSNSKNDCKCRPHFIIYRTDFCPPGFLVE